MKGEISCAGYCTRCRCEHWLPLGRSHGEALRVMEEFDRTGRLDYLAADGEARPEFRFERIFSGERGHMFGVMECRDPRGETVWLRAFSSLHGGVRHIAGWAPSILAEDDYRSLVLPGQQRIKVLTRERDAPGLGDAARRSLGEERRQISRRLMGEIHDRYRLRNFRGEEKPLREVFRGEGEGIPGGVGDCCAPKLLQHAAERGLRPVSVAEFFWGGSNRSGNKRPGQFFPACEDKCRPILGFMLCGLDEG